MYRKTSQGWLKHWDFMVIDMVCLNAAFVLAYILRNGFSNPYADITYLRLAVIFTLVDILVILFFNSLRDVLKRGYYKEFAETVKHTCLVLLIVTFYLFSAQDSEKYSRLVYYYFGIAYVLIAYPARLAWKGFLRTNPKLGGVRSLFVVTTSGMAEKTIKNLEASSYGTFRITGLALVDCDLRGREVCSVKVLAGRDDIVGHLRREWVDEVFLNLPPEEPYPEELATQLFEMGMVVHMNLMHQQTMGGKQFVEQLGNYSVLSTSINYATTRQLFIKRAMDICGGLAGCLITLVLAVIIGPVIYAKSPGPIFFSQVRIGRNGRKFKMYKFRSMYIDAEERKKELMEQNRVKDGLMFKLDYDPRIIGSKRLPDGTVKKGIGNYIRDLSLDEFPQFFNVLKGEMSLVGTRPPTLDEWEKYELHHRARLAAKPGITGMWQVSGRSNITDFEEVVELDKKYIREWSMGLDIRILLKTVGVVFKKDGAM